jgi:hypothetical protein
MQDQANTVATDETTTVVQEVESAVPAVVPAATEVPAMQAGDRVEVVKVVPLANNTVAPALSLGEVKTIKTVVKDSKGNPHFDVGLPSNLSYVRSIETGEHLPDGDKIHWCHPSRFKLVV